VAIRWTWKGTQTGLFRNIPATGKAINSEGILIFRLRNGKLIGSSTETDRLGFLEKLGVVNVKF
jgi:hypothetical protein